VTASDVQVFGGIDHFHKEKFNHADQILILTTERSDILHCLLELVFFKVLQLQIQLFLEHGPWHGQSTMGAA
jgi:hypothetical protein